MDITSFMHILLNILEILRTIMEIFSLHPKVDLNLALGMLMSNPMFEEAEPEFQHLASFATRIGLRNALQDEMIPGMSKDQEALLISLKRPIFFVQPSAFDKGIFECVYFMVHIFLHCNVVDTFCKLKNRPHYYNR